MKTTDAVRLTAAYLLIASSGRVARTSHAESDVSTHANSNNKAAAGGATPADVPARGWLDIAKSVWTKIGKNRVVSVAAGLTFYGILAIFPAITALVSIYGLFADPATIQKQLAQLSGVLPEGAISVIGDQVQRIAAQGSGTLGFAFITGLAVALWSANAGVKALFDALNVAYETEETRGFFRLNAVSLLFTISAVGVLIAGLSLTVILPWVLEHVFLGLSLFATIIQWLSIPFAIGAALFMLAALYRYGPAIRKPAWKWVTPGGIFAVISLIISSCAFAYYAAHFGNYNKTYGTLGAAIGLMTWMWISSIVVMIGAEVNAEVEREIKADTAGSQNTAPR